MRYALFPVLTSGFLSLAQAALTSPAAGDSWGVGSKQTISWDTTGLTAPIDIHLVPAGATNTTVILEDIVLKTENTGGFDWSPDKVQSSAAILIVDAKQVIVVSETFQITILDTTSTSKKITSTSSLKTTSSDKTTTLKSTITKVITGTGLATAKAGTITSLFTQSSSIALKANATSTKALTAGTSTKLTTGTTTSKSSTTSKLLITSTSTGKLTSATSSAKPVNSTLSMKVNATAATAASATRAVSTGAAVPIKDFNGLYSVFAGGVVGVLGLMLL